jgi:putative methyltransferase (TIGR04325 family)
MFLCEIVQLKTKKGWEEHFMTELRRRHTPFSVARWVSRRAVRIIGAWPGVRHIHYGFHRWQFLAGRNNSGNSGVFSSFEEAMRSAPTSVIGYDQTEMADLDVYRHANGEFKPMPSTEYPALFWLRPAIEGGACRLFDLGGYVGHVYYQYRDYLDLPDEFSWTIYDLPGITRAGKRIAEERRAKHLRFTNDISAIGEADIVFAAGSLQYLEEGFLHQALSEAVRLPPHLIIHRTALHPTRSFVTLQSIVKRSGRIAFCAYTVAHRERFIQRLQALGYVQVDAWEKQRPVEVPLHPECYVETYAGIYFRLKPTASA